MTKQELLELLKENLTIETDLTTKSEYVGDMGSGGNLYQDSHTLIIRLVFDGEVLSESKEYL